ncbi:hypothetical protein DFH09DRAFT_1342055 [Mycena vulgaris]|nr:hypothetical protein DFH09DRAFT_1342055 [Mycena vulgaris]
MSSATSVPNLEVPVSAPAAKFSFSRKPIPVSPQFAENGVRDFLQEQGTSVSAPGPSRDVRKDGGTPSSAAFTGEQAKDADRFVALNLETRDQSVSLSTQMKRDFLVAQASLQVPTAFAVGSSLATRPISRTASMATEVADPTTPTEHPADDFDAPIDDATPIFLATHKEVSQALHLAGPPTTKAGQKEKAETAVAAAARANGNITRLGGKLLATERKVDGQFLAVKNELRALASKVQHINPGKLEEKFGILEAVVRNCIDSFDGRLTDAASGGGSDARVALHTSDIARLSDTLDTMKNKLALAATRSDLNNLYGSVRDALEGVDNTIAEKLAPVDANAEEVVSQLAKLDARVARMERKQEDGERESLVIRENVARAQTDFSTFMLRSTPAFTSTPAPAPAVAPADANLAATNPFQFAVGAKKQHKRKASVELVSGPAKRIGGKPDKAAFQHRVDVGPVNADTKNLAPAFFKKLVEAAAPAYHLPATWIERSQNPAYLPVSFASANDANAFVGGWAGASATMPAGLRGISVTHAAVAGSSTAPNTISFLTGN